MAKKRRPPGGAAYGHKSGGGKLDLTGFMKPNEISRPIKMDEGGEFYEGTPTMERPKFWRNLLSGGQLGLQSSAFNQGMTGTDYENELARSAATLQSNLNIGEARHKKLTDSGFVDEKGEEFYRSNIQPLVGENMRLGKVIEGGNLRPIAGEVGTHKYNKAVLDKEYAGLEKPRSDLNQAAANTALINRHANEPFVLKQGDFATPMDWTKGRSLYNTPVSSMGGGLAGLGGLGLTGDETGLGVGGVSPYAGNPVRMYGPEGQQIGIRKKVNPAESDMPAEAPWLPPASKYDMSNPIDRALWEREKKRLGIDDDEERQELPTVTWPGYSH